jgi:hypothetical protein
MDAPARHGRKQNFLRLPGVASSVASSTIEDQGRCSDRRRDVANREDATLLVQLAQWGSTMGLEEAQHAVWSDTFDPETASAEDVLVSRILNWGETVGTLTKNGLLDTDLVLDWLWVSGLWARVGPAALRLREKQGVPELYENFEALARRQG